MYRNYIFDLYGTIIDVHTNEQKGYLWDKMSYVYSATGAEYTSKELKERYGFFCSEEMRTVREQTGRKYCDIKIERVFKRLFEAKGIYVVPDGDFRKIDEISIK